MVTVYVARACHEMLALQSDFVQEGAASAVFAHERERRIKANADNDKTSRWTSVCPQLV
jgi:hypothetical protein